MAQKNSSVSNDLFTCLKRLHSPPQAVKEIITATFLLLGHPHAEAKEWKFARQQMTQTRENAPAFRIQNLDPKSVTMEQCQLAKKILEPFSPEMVKNVSHEGLQLYKWTISAVEAS